MNLTRNYYNLLINRQKQLFNLINMEIIKFDQSVHSISKTAELVLEAYKLDPDRKEQTKETVKGLIESGNNFLGYENIYIATERDYMAGLIICYPGRPSGTIKTLINLLIELRLKELLNLIILNAELLHTGYTPDLKEDDFYISLLVVDEGFRGMGLGTKLLKKAIELAEERECSRLVLDVDSDNSGAKELYEKVGFKLRDAGPVSVKGSFPSEIYTMDYYLDNSPQNIERRLSA